MQLYITIVFIIFYIEIKMRVVVMVVVMVMVVVVTEAAPGVTLGQKKPVSDKKKVIGKLMSIFRHFIFYMREKIDVLKKMLEN